jgi:hypothetical protein
MAGTVMLLSACGGSGAGGKTASRAELAATYVDIVTPLQRAEAQYESSRGRASAIPPLQAAFRSAGSALLRVAWPGRTENDVRGLVSSFDAINSELGLQLGDPAAASSQAFSEYLSAEKTDSTNVRTELGLPVTDTTP